MSMPPEFSGSPGIFASALAGQHLHGSDEEAVGLGEQGDILGWEYHAGTTLAYELMKLMEKYKMRVSSGIDHRLFLAVVFCSSRMRSQVWDISRILPS